MTLLKFISLDNSSYLSGKLTAADSSTSQGITVTVNWMSIRWEISTDAL